ncbi:MAG: hypothetical protein HRU20_17765 [Pseudomonadales bacterium]|nr:hypothetical protein [Pseudomonadales bacterium]
MNSHGFLNTLLDEVDAMASYVSGQGLSLPAEVPAFLYTQKHKINVSEDPATDPDLTCFNQEELEKLAGFHLELSQLISPAKPKTIKLMADEAKSAGLLYFLGPVKLIRSLSLLAIFMLISIIAVSTSPDVNKITISQGLFESEGVVLLLNQIFLLGCAGLGACFACISKVSTYIEKDIYDPKYDSTYWTLIIMGLMGGVIIAELIPLQSLDDNASAALTGFNKPLFALLGGFSADLIYRILNRFIDVIHQLLGIENKASQPEIVRDNRLEKPSPKNQNNKNKVATNETPLTALNKKQR